MKKAVTSMFLMLALLFTSTGCLTGGGPTTPADNKLAIKVSSELVTSITLANVKEADRVNVARYVYAVASGISDAAVAGQIDRAALSLLSQKLLANVSVQYRASVGVLVSYVEAVVVHRINQHLATATTDEKAKAFAEFIVAASDGIKTASLVYTGGVPDGVVIGARSEDTGTIKVPVLKWR